MHAQDSLARAVAKAAARSTFNHGIGWVLLAVSVVITVANWQVLAQQLRRRSREEQAPSFVPIVGGLVGVAGLGMLEVPWTWRWVPVLADVGCGPYLLLMAWALLFNRESSPPPSDASSPPPDPS